MIEVFKNEGTAKFSVALSYFAEVQSESCMGYIRTVKICPAKFNRYYLLKNNEPYYKRD